MAKLYVFGIGGTGGRVLKSLTMLLATGVQTKFEIVPIIIDPDGAGGDLNRTSKILREYQQIHDAIDNYQHSDFFKNKITTLGNIAKDQKKGGKIFDGFQFELNGIQNDKFKDFIGYNSMDTNNMALTELLFSDKNLNADLEVGFKGNPNIGSVVLNQFTKSEFYHNFATNFQTDDRIFIISSIFGGTGAAGFPLLLKNIRKGRIDNANYEALKNAKIGAITVQPYFTLGKNDDSEIDSHNFITKTKAALNYYATSVTGNNSVNAMYYIGDVAKTEYENIEGGESQKNKAHFVELASALSVIDFASMEDFDLEVNEGTAVSPKYKEFGIKDCKTISFNELYPRTEKLIKKNLTKYFYFNLFEKERIIKNLKDPFAREHQPQIDENFFSYPFFKTLEDFNKSFRIWLAELKDNDISFAPFAINVVKDNQHTITDFTIGSDNIFTLLNNISERKTGGFGLFQKKNFELYRAELNNSADEIEDAPDVSKRYIGIFSKATQTLIDTKLF
ncbi:hypothetical protein [Kordia jejudonensis]|uniref:hypothetical protein n=1 Tax=Kordia jejudonensis TaxID=1348245 RepID=UPI000629BC49|nr:hypothetical protein [Kordia jejudonensis]